MPGVGSPEEARRKIGLALKSYSKSTTDYPDNCLFFFKGEKEGDSKGHLVLLRRVKSDTGFTAERESRNKDGSLVHTRELPCGSSE